jgi:hypothetical protein
VASTCSTPPALVSICWGSGGGGSGSVASSFSGGGSCAFSSSVCLTGGSGVEVAETGSSSFNPKADNNSKKNRSYIMNKELHLQRGFLHAGLLQSQCPWFYNHGTHCRWRGRTSQGHGMSRQGTCHGNSYNPCRCSRRVHPSSFCGTTCWNIIPANSVPATFWRLGSGGEEERLQHRQSKHPTNTRLDRSTRRRPHT